MARQNPCPVPGCNRNIGFSSKYGVCFYHDDMFQAITYYMKKAQEEIMMARRKGVRPGDIVTKSGLILPH